MIYIIENGNTVGPIAQRSLSHSVLHHRSFHFSSFGSLWSQHYLPLLRKQVDSVDRADRTFFPSTGLRWCSALLVCFSILRMSGNSMGSQINDSGDLIRYMIIQIGGSRKSIRLVGRDHNCGWHVVWPMLNHYNLRLKQNVDSWGIGLVTLYICTKHICKFH